MSKKKKEPEYNFIKVLKLMGACQPGIEYAQSHKKFSSAWNKCKNEGWMEWLILKLKMRSKFPSCDEDSYPNKCPGCMAVIKWENMVSRPSSIRKKYTAEKVERKLKAYYKQYQGTIEKRGLFLDEF